MTLIPLGRIFYSAKNLPGGIFNRHNQFSKTNSCAIMGKAGRLGGISYDREKNSEAPFG